MTASPSNDRRSATEGSQTRGHLRLLWDVMFRVLRLIGKYAHNAYAIFGIFLLSGAALAVVCTWAFSEIAEKVRAGSTQSFDEAVMRWIAAHQYPALQTAMLENGTEAGPLPPAVGADEWLRLLADLPLAYQPGEGWRYHHSFAVLGILLSRLAGRPLGEHLADDLFSPLGMTDTGFWVQNDRLERLPAAYRHGGHGLVETEPAGSGFYAGPPPFDVSHGELVSTAQDFHRFVRALVNGSLVSAEHLELLRTDQVPSSCKTPESFFPGFWTAMGWGFGVAVQAQGPHRDRFGWSGGQGTDFFVDPDGRVAVLLTQVEMGPAIFPLIGEFQTV